MRQHRDSGCKECDEFLESFFPQKSKLKITKSVAADLKEALEELFTALKMDYLLVESELEVKTQNFIKDFIKMCDEVKTEQSIVDMWHIDPLVAEKLFMLFNEVIFGEFENSLECDDEDDSSSLYSDVLDQSSDSD